jgi:hypothetical protein
LKTFFSVINISVTQLNVVMFSFLVDPSIKTDEPGRIDTILQDDQQQIPPAPVSIEKTMVSKTLPAAAPDLCF